MMWFCGLRTIGIYNFGKFGRWEIGSLELWDFGTVGLLDRWTLGHWDSITLGLCVGLWNFGTYGFVDSWTLELWGFDESGLLGFWIWEFRTLAFVASLGLRIAGFGTLGPQPFNVQFRLCYVNLFCMIYDFVVFVLVLKGMGEFCDFVHLRGLNSWTVVHLDF